MRLWKVDTLSAELLQESHQPPQHLKATIAELEREVRASKPGKELLHQAPLHQADPHGERMPTT